MISNLDGASQRFLSDIARMQRDAAEANRQISSGKRVATPADAPDAISTALQVHAELASNTQIKSNLGLAAADASAADYALSSAVKLLDQARTLGSQGTGPTMDATSRAALANRIESIQEQMVGLANTTVRGRYVFSGDQMDTPSYQLDLTQTGGVTPVSTAVSTQRIQDPAGGSFAAAKTAREIFDPRDANGIPDPDNVFAALNALRLALAAPGGATTPITESISALAKASDRLNTMAAFYGSVETRIQDAQASAGKRDVQLQTQLSDLEDADVAAAALQLTQANTHLNAAFQARGQIPNKTLFDYLG